MEPSQLPDIETLRTIAAATGIQHNGAGLLPRPDTVPRRRGLLGDAPGAGTPPLLVAPQPLSSTPKPAPRPGVPSVPEKMRRRLGPGGKPPKVCGKLLAHDFFEVIAVEPDVLNNSYFNTSSVVQS